MGGGRRTQAGAKTLPMTPGHEIAGEVVAFGADATGVALGDRRVVYPWIGCGLPDCQECAVEATVNKCAASGLGVRFHGGFFGATCWRSHPQVSGGLWFASHRTCRDLRLLWSDGLRCAQEVREPWPVCRTGSSGIIGAGGRLGCPQCDLARTVTGQALIVAEIDLGQTGGGTGERR